MGNRGEYKTGDIVRLKSGGPRMTVVGYDPISENRVICQWFVGGRLSSGRFESGIIEPVEEPSNERGETVKSKTRNR